MSKQINALVLNGIDDVAVALEELKPNDTVLYRIGNEEKSVGVIQEIPIYHKLALRNISEGELVRKYGQVIGKATCMIKTGEHVHVHNLVSEVEA